MGQVYSKIPDDLQPWLVAQPVFFVGSAPLAGGHVNVSPKGMQGTFAVLDAHRVAYLDYFGSGVETIAHLREPDNARLTLMLCAFVGKPQIIRLFGVGRYVLPDAAEFAELRGHFPKERTVGVRAVIVLDVERVTSSCGFGVPFMEYQGDRPTLDATQSARPEGFYETYRQAGSAFSLDGLPALAPPLPDGVVTSATQPGWAVVGAALEAAVRSELGPQLVSVYALGSLAHGGFSADVSDVDLALILDHVDDSTPPLMGHVKEQVMQAVPGPLGQRLSLFWSTWDALCTGETLGRFPLVDRLDLRRDGVLLYGEDRRREVPTPSTAQLIVNTAEFIAAKLAPSDPTPLREPSLLMAQGTRAVCKAVLLPVRFIATAQTGRFLGNPEAASHYLTTGADPAAAGLASAANRWRHHGIDDVRAAASLLRAGIPPLYQQLAATLHPLLIDANRRDLATQIDAWADSLGARTASR